jgi:hypothetical protein
VEREKISNFLFANAHFIFSHSLHYEMDEEHYVTRDLRTVLEYEGPLTRDMRSPHHHFGRTFVPYMVGGCGHKYTEEEIKFMRQLHTNGWTIGTGIVNKYSDTALHIAHCHDNQPMIDFLLEMGADTDATNYRGKKPQDLGF